MPEQREPMLEHIVHLKPLLYMVANRDGATLENPIAEKMARHKFHTVLRCVLFDFEWLFPILLKDMKFSIRIRVLAARNLFICSFVWLIFIEELEQALGTVHILRKHFFVLF